MPRVPARHTGEGRLRLFRVGGLPHPTRLNGRLPYRQSGNFPVEIFKRVARPAIYYDRAGRIVAPAKGMSCRCASSAVAS
jgi:hypothetical protein